VNTQARSVIIATLNTAPSWPVNGIISQSLLLIKLQLKMMHHSKKKSTNTATNSPSGGLIAQVHWLGLRVGGHPALSLHSSDEPGELSYRLWS